MQHLLMHVGRKACCHLSGELQVNPRVNPTFREKFCELCLSLVPTAPTASAACAGGAARVPVQAALHRAVAGRLQDTGAGVGVDTLLGQLSSAYRLQPPQVYVVPPPPLDLGLGPSAERKVASGEAQGRCSTYVRNSACRLGMCVKGGGGGGMLSHSLPATLVSQSAAACLYSAHLRLPVWRVGVSINWSAPPCCCRDHAVPPAASPMPLASGSSCSSGLQPSSSRGTHEVTLSVQGRKAGAIKKSERLSLMPHTLGIDVSAL